MIEKLTTLAAWCGGKVDGEADISNVVTDSRKVKCGDLFVPVVGENVDGHDYIASAAANGASAALTQRDEACPIPSIRVKNTVTALQDIAKEYRAKFDLPIVGVTGSVGKTTTKEMLRSVLSAAFPTYATSGNMNSMIGVAVALLGLDDTYRAAVIEMGMSQKGEIDRLSEITRPTYGVVTNIGVAHIEYLGSRENIRNAKMEMYRNLTPNGKMILNADEPLLWEMKSELGQKAVYYGIENRDADVVAKLVSDSAECQTFTVTAFPECEFTLNVAGKHNVYNAAAAAAVAKLMGLSAEQYGAGIASFSTASNRLGVTDHDGITVINDTYNASPDSMRAALCVLEARTGRKIAVLGEMRELGAIADQAHIEIGKAAAFADELIFVAEQSENYANGARSGGNEHIHLVKDTDSAAELLKKIMGKGDNVLFKASRGVHMERVIEKLFAEGK